jgi:hypothetical protein
MAGWFYLRNDDGRLPPYTGHVVMERPSKWRWGAPDPEQPKLQSLLDALKRLRDGDLTVVGVVVAFHRRRVLSLMARRLRLDQMEEGASLEGCRMFDTSLTVVEVTRRVTYTVAMGFTMADLNRVKMRPTRGYISLVSATSLPILFRFLFIGFFLYC